MSGITICRSIPEIRDFLGPARLDSVKIGFVPTMGYLHAAHLSLVELAKQSSDLVVVSIFVNPAQFNNQDDFEKYPIDLDRDLQLLQERGVQAAFLPTVEEIYPENFQTWVEVERISSPYEGEFRPGHFKGVASVVSMLFNIVQPDIAVFGEKDFQQLRLIEQMVADLKFDLEIVRAPLMREEDGLAMSSRNVRLSPESRQSALILSQALFKARKLAVDGQAQATEVINEIRAVIDSEHEVRLEYLEIVNEHTLEPVAEIGEGTRVLIAAWAGGVRLLDNIALYH